MNDLNFTGKVTIAAAGDEKSGPRRFDMNAYFGGALKLNGLTLPVVVDLATLKGTEKSRPVLKDHDPKVVVGHTDGIQNDGRQLTATGVMSGAGASPAEIIAAADNGFPWAVSIGASAGKLQRVNEGDSITVNNQTFQGPVLVARGAALREISFVSIGADEEASARIAAQYAQGDPMTAFEQWLEAQGFKLAELSDQQKSTLQAAYDAAQIPPAPRPAPGVTPAGQNLNTILAAEKQKEDRRQAITNLTARAIQDHPGQFQLIEAMSRPALEAAMDEKEYELQLLRALRPQAGNYTRRSQDEGLTNEVVEAGICLGSGLESPDKVFSEQTLDAASRRWKHGLGLVEALTLFARRNGYDSIGTRDVGRLLRAAFAEGTEIRASGVSTLSLPGILANTANKYLRQGFNAVESTWREIAAIRSVRDFKQISSYSLTGDFEYDEIPPGGKIDHGEVGELSYTNQAKTYGRMFGIDRRDIINDDIGALTSIPKMLGRGGAIKFNKVFWTAFLNNASFFTTGNLNYLAGATPGTNDTRMVIEGLTRAEQMFLDQTDPDGNPIAATPRILLVPNGLLATASQLMNSTEIRDTTASTTFGTSNPHAGKFKVVRSSYLSSTAITGYSTAAWYLLADPNDVPVIEAAFLNGVETPTVESADADFDSLGIQMRGYHDFGVALQEYRGAVKLKGAA